MIKWKPFVREGVSHTLDHLHPRRVEYIQSATAPQVPRKYLVQLIFGLHCFTRSPAPDETVDLTLHYSDSRETRLFCPRRYRLSFLLPAIMEWTVGAPLLPHREGQFFRDRHCRRWRNQAGIRGVFSGLSFQSTRRIEPVHPKRLHSRQITRQQPSRQKTCSTARDPARRAQWPDAKRASSLIRQ